jgi:hypothetical protein
MPLGTQQNLSVVSRASPSEHVIFGDVDEMQLFHCSKEEIHPEQSAFYVVGN